MSGKVINIFLIGIFLITLIVFISYIIKERDHRTEIEKIRALEEINKKRQNELEIVRQRTVACPIENLNDPRSCYYDSNFQCSWNKEAERCDVR